MKDFQYFQPTEIRFGRGRAAEVGEVVARFGKRCLLVTEPAASPLAPIYKRVKQALESAKVAVAHFDGVIPNPTVEVVRAGSEMARDHQVDVTLGVGGGSSMDTAKAIAVECTHPGSCFDYIWSSAQQPTEKTLPVVVVTTTSGTGSQVTQVAVVTNPEERYKAALYNERLFPRAAVVDPELMVSLPRRATASTGWDAFTHAFEAYLHANSSPYTDLLALEAIRLIAHNLPLALADGGNLDARSAMAWADTLAGLCIANAGVTLPHGMAMAISGFYPHIWHGQALAVTYPAFTRYTAPRAVERFATIGRILDPALQHVSNVRSAEGCCAALDAFMRDIGMWVCLADYDVPEAELPALAEACLVLPDYTNNPRVATEAEILEILEVSHRHS
jgi:alcohol dehydrogenase class IV